MLTYIVSFYMLDCAIVLTLALIAFDILQIFME